MNTIEATMTVVDIHGLTFVDEPAIQITGWDQMDPVDELSCDECGRWVAWVTDGEGNGEFVYYGISKPSQVVLIHCEDCYE